ncbi:MAG: hypothetical protein ACNA7V_03955 [Bacteroidales bacterium]
MKNTILTLTVLLFTFITGNILAQGEGLTIAYVTGPECCPDLGTFTGNRTCGGYASAVYWGTTNGNGPSYYNIPWYGADFYEVCLTTLSVETVEGKADIHGNGVKVPILCRGSETKNIGYGAPLVFNIELSVLEVGEPGPPPPED